MGVTAPDAVVHLVWGQAGLEPFDAFVRSYEVHDAGAEHELVLLLNGVDDPAPYRERVGRPVRELAVPERCLDLAAYAFAVSALEHERLCFLNSYSELLAPDWLAKLGTALRDTGAGIAGASGSWASHSSYERWQLGIERGGYARAFESRAAARRAMCELSGTPVPRALPAWLFTATQLRNHRGTARFPCPHLRTNAFMATRERLRELRLAPAATKWDTYRLESGPRSLTAQVTAAGAPPVVVDARGTARAVADWPDGDVFFQRDQRDLLVADNQSRSYADATPEQRAVLAAFAWGDRARPAS